MIGPNVGFVDLPMTNDELSRLKRLERQARSDPEYVPIDPLSRALEHRDESVREGAVTALYAISKAHPERLADVTAQLAPLLESDRPMLRTKTALTMVAVGTEQPETLSRHAPAFIDLLEDDSESVRRSASEALVRISAEDPGRLTAAVPNLASVLQSNIQETRLNAVTVLDRLAKRRSDAVVAAVGPLLELLEDPHRTPTDITYDPAAAGDRSRPSHQLRGYRSIVNDRAGRSSNVRARERAASTVATLAATGSTNALEALDVHLPRLIDLLHDRNPSIRGEAVAVLASVAEENPRAVEPAESDLIDLLDEPFAISADAIRALRFVGSPRALEALEGAARDESVDATVRALAERVLEETGS